MKIETVWQSFVEGVPGCDGGRTWTPAVGSPAIGSAQVKTRLARSLESNPKDREIPESLAKNSQSSKGCVSALKNSSVEE